MLQELWLCTFVSRTLSFLDRYFANGNRYFANAISTDGYQRLEHVAGESCCIQEIKARTIFSDAVSAHFTPYTRESSVTVLSVATIILDNIPVPFLKQG